MLARPDRRTAAVCGVTGTNVLVAVALWLTDGRLLREPVISSWHARAWTLALMFALTEAVVLHVQMGRETPAISLSEIPLVLGLVYASPVTLLATRFVGSAAVLIGYRRQPPLRAAYNLAVQAAEASVALAVFGALSGPPGALPPRTIVAVYAAVLSGAVLTGWSLRTVIGVSEGSVTLRGYLDGLVEYPPVAIGVATLGFVAAYGLRAGADGAWALVVTLAGLLGGYRLYGRLRLRHESLERLFDFTQSLPDASESQEAPHRLLDAVRTMMNAEYAALVLTDRRGGPPQVVISRPDDLTAVSAADDRTVAVAVHERLLADRQPVLHPRSNRPGDGRAARPGVLRDLVATSLDDGTEPLGSLIVANRVGSVQTFTRDDLQLLQTVSRQAAA